MFLNLSTNVQEGTTVDGKARGIFLCTEYDIS